MPQTIRVPYQKILDAYNSACPPAGMAKAKMTEARRAKLRTRWKEPEFQENYQTLFTKAAASDFLTGRNDRGWRADFAWLIQSEENYVKVLEGRYDANRKEVDYSNGF